MALVLYTDAASGNDNNGGSSAGAAKVTGTAATTNGTATVQLDIGADLSAVVAGDTIRIAARTDGIRSSNIYEILTVDNGLDQVTVTPSPAAAAGQTWSIGGAFATMGKAEDVVLANDKVWVKASANYNETVTFASAAVGGSTSPVVWEGYSSAIGDDGIATIDGQNTRATCVTATAPTAMHTVFKNFRFTDATGNGWNGDSGTAHVKFKKCRFDNHGGAGVVGASSFTFEGCYSHDNGGEGYSLAGFSVFLGCIAEGNGADGFSTQGCLAWKCLSIGNLGYNYNSTLATSHLFVECVADGDNETSTAGFDLGSAFGGTTNACLINCIVYDNVTGVIAISGYGEKYMSRNNLVNSNGTAYSGTGFGTFEGEVTSAPSFVNEASQDYGIQSGSPAKNTGFGVNTHSWITLTGDSPDIGALDEASSAASAAGSRGMKSGGQL